MVLPTVYGPAEVTDFTTVIAGFCAVGVSTVLGGVVTGGGVGPPGGVGGWPVTVALLCTLPAATSVAVTVWLPVQVVEAPGASVVTGQTAGASSNASFTTMLSRDTSPVLVTTNW